MSIAINLKMRHPSQLCPVLAFGGMPGPVFGFQNAPIPVKPGI
jgi:hypothetical protein